MNRFAQCMVFGISCVLLISLSSCDEQTVNGDSEINKVVIDSNRTEIVKVSGNLFSIPSPIQTALLIKKTNTPYNRGSLSDAKRADEIMTNNARALNLGVYGTDMAFASLFSDGQTALQYFKAIENLSSALEIKNAIDPTLIKRLGKNVGNSDSLLVLSGEFYRNSDGYLKTNERYDIAALILAGGWVESVYLTVLATRDGNGAARKRLAAQKETVKTLSDVLDELANEEFLRSEIKSQLDSLNTAFKDVKYSYTFVKPETDSENKTTIIKSKSEYNLSDEQVKDLSRRIEDLRANIIQ